MAIYIYIRAVAQREVRPCEFVDEAGLEHDHAALLAVFPHDEGEYVAIPIYFRAVAQGEVRPCQIVDEAGLELHHRGLNALLSLHRPATIMHTASSTRNALLARVKPLINRTLNFPRFEFMRPAMIKFRLGTISAL